LHDTLQWMELLVKRNSGTEGAGVVRCIWQQVDAAMHCLWNPSASRPGEAMRVFCVQSWWLQCMRVDVPDAAAFHVWHQLQNSRHVGLRAASGLCSAFMLDLMASRPEEAMCVVCIHSWWLQCMCIDDVHDADAFHVWHPCML